MPSTATLTTLKARIGAALADATYTLWTSDILEEAIRRALADYTAAAPYRTHTDLSLASVLSSDGREINVSGIVDIIHPIDLWTPYTATETAHNARRFGYWLDSQTLVIQDGEAAKSTDTARVFYTRPHIINGLDGESVTTLRTGDDSLIIGGAIGYAAQSRAAAIIDEVTISPAAASDFIKLSRDTLDQFHKQLDAITAATADTTQARAS